MHVVQAMVFANRPVDAPLFKRTLVRDMHAPVEIFVSAVIRGNRSEAAPQTMPSRQFLNAPDNGEVETEEQDQRPPVHRDMVGFFAFRQGIGMVPLGRSDGG